MSYTKGKWVLNTHTSEIFSENECSKNGGIDRIAQCFCGFNYIDTIEEAKANAKLVASAPELLKACQNALKDVQKLNKQLIAEGKHGYVLMENELNESIKLALGS